jgi:hypothetical protein
MALTEAQSIYYGLQLIGLHMPDELRADKLFVMRASCVPLSEWTDSMWMEGARIVSVHRGIFIAAGQPDPISFDGLVRRMADKPPTSQGLIDARDATPRPSEEQLEEVRELATVLAAERGANAPLFDVTLTPDFGFAVINVSRSIFANMTALPGYCEVDGQAQCWLCSELADFIVASRLQVQSTVLAAIVREVKRIEGAAPWALVLEKASTCSDPDKYPAQLMSMLETMHLKGIEWRD